MIHTAPFTDASWMRIVDHYFDNVHWIGEERNPKYQSPNDWVWNEFDCLVDTGNREYVFADEKQRNWFVMRWL